MANRAPRGAFGPGVDAELARMLCASSGHRHDGSFHGPVHESADYSERGYVYRGTWCTRCGSQLSRLVVSSPAPVAALAAP